MGLFCSHEFVNVGSGMDDLWRCTHCKKETERNPAYGSIFSSLTCNHTWEPYGCLDDDVRCTKCGKIRTYRSDDELISREILSPHTPDSSVPIKPNKIGFYF